MSGGWRAAEYTHATILQVRAIYWVVEVSEWECLLWCESSCASVNKPWKWVTHSSIFSGRSLTAWLPLWGSGISLRWLSCMAKAQDLIPSLLKQQILETDGRRTHTHTHTRGGRAFLGRPTWIWLVDYGCLLDVILSGLSPQAPITVYVIIWESRFPSEFWKAMALLRSGKETWGEKRDK